MKINVKAKPTYTIRAFYLFFIIIAVQTGVGIMGAPAYVFQFAEQDSWISILMAFVYTVIVTFVMFMILDQYENADIFGIQVDIFGKWIGKLFGTIIIMYFFLTLLTVLLTYIEVTQVYLSPTFPSFTAGFLLLFIIVYTVLGGIRVIVGTCFLFFLASQILLIFLYDPIMQMDWKHFFPMFQHSLPELLQGMKKTTYTFSGFEILLIIYPFIENKRKAKLPTILGLVYTAAIFLLVTVISIGYFSLNRITEHEWLVLTLFKNLSSSFVERLDYAVVIEWMMVVIPNNILLMWAITYGVKRLYHVRQKTSLYFFAGLLLLIIPFIKYDLHIVKLRDYVARAGFWIVFVYPFVLLPIILIKKKWFAKKGLKKQ